MIVLTFETDAPSAGRSVGRVEANVIKIGAIVRRSGRVLRMVEAHLPAIYPTVPMSGTIMPAIVTQIRISGSRMLTFAAKNPSVTFSRLVFAGNGAF